MCVKPADEEKSAPAPWQHCASEHGNCRCSGVVRYGESGKFVYRHSSESLGCNNNVFGDPIPGTYKQCHCRPQKKATVALKRWEHCASEGGNCQCNGTVRYGENGKFAFGNSSGRLACNNATFGDPIPGVYKQCYCKEGGNSSDNSRPVTCAWEGETCNCHGRVRYGHHGRYNFRNVNGNIGCNNNNFGDPLVGTRKECVCFPQ